MLSSRVPQSTIDAPRRRSVFPSPALAIFVWSLMHVSHKHETAKVVLAAKKSPLHPLSLNNG